MSMKSSILIALTATLLSSGAYATDVFSGDKSLKDDKNYVSGSVANHSGFYITGSLGVASIDRSARRDITRGVDAHLDTTGADPDDVQDLRDALNASSIPNSLDGNTLTIPLIGDHLGLSGSEDLSSTVFGGGVSYLFQMPSSRIGFSLGLDATFYSDAESKGGHVDAIGNFVGGTALADVNTGGFSCANIGTCAGQPAFLGPLGLTQTGFVSFDRDFDIDIPIKLHYFATERLGFNVGVGPSFARGSLKGGNVATDAATAALDGALPGFASGLNTGFNDEDTSIGYVITAGAQYWLTDRIVLGVQGDYKHHTFEFDASSSATVPVGGPLSVSTHSRDSVEVEDDVYSVKATASFKLN